MYFPLLSYTCYRFDAPQQGFFDRVDTSGGRFPHHDDVGGGEFVSAVSWRSGTNVVVGANSQGTIKILELQ